MDDIHIIRDPFRVMGQPRASLICEERAMGYTNAEKVDQREPKQSGSNEHSFEVGCFSFSKSILCPLAKLGAVRMAISH